mmetsp:Transcript_924/g.2829  ORF Transcript_924/g.2829 Transcript_924/m.2829 type:complete len:82 (-) Transcript_924:750-995(-)
MQCLLQAEQLSGRVPVLITSISIPTSSKTSSLKLLVYLLLNSNSGRYTAQQLAWLSAALNPKLTCLNHHTRFKIGATPDQT